MMTETALLRRLIRELITEDSVGFVDELLKSAQTWDEIEQIFSRNGFFGADTAASRDLKRAFRVHADHAFLKQLVTIHWASDLKALNRLSGAGRDEISTTLHAPGEPIKAYRPVGLWVRGRITLAAHDEDKMWTGFYREYTGLLDSERDLSWEEQEARREKRAASRVQSGLRRRPGRAPTEELLRKIAGGSAPQPYILDAETWAAGRGDRTNEAIVGAWRPVGLVLADESDLDLSSGPRALARREQIGIYNLRLEEIWSPVG